MDANDEEIDFDDICKAELYSDCNQFSISDQPAGNKQFIEIRVNSDYVVNYGSATLQFTIAYLDGYTRL